MANKNKKAPTETPAGRAASGKSKSKAAKGKPAKSREAQPIMISENRRARHRFEIMEQLECGIVLWGSEVKSLRDGKISLDEAYVRVHKGALYLFNADISHYSQASIWNHAPRRDRKLLLHKKEIERLSEQALTKGLTLIPMKMYFNERGVIKLIVAVGRGKKVHDKRETMKAQDVRRQIDREMKTRNQNR